MLFRLVQSGQANSRAALAKSTGMSRSAVNTAVAKLIESGRLIESGEEPKGVGSGSGRPRTTLVTAPGVALLGGIDFSHDHFRVALGDGTGAVLAEERYDVDVDLHATEAMDRAAEALLSLADGRKLDAVAAGIPGPLDSSNGLVSSATILSSWVGLNPAVELGRRLDTVVHPENDAVLGAMGELRAAPRTAASTIMYVRAAAGLGSALIVDGRPFRGANGLAGEIGHTPLASRGEQCRCGKRGCLEAVVSYQVVLERLRVCHPSLPAGEVTLRSPADESSNRVLGEAGSTLGEVLGMFCNLVNPTALVIGGELGESGPAFFEGVESGVRRHAMPGIANALKVTPAVLGDRSEIVGALAMAARLAY